MQFCRLPMIYSGTPLYDCVPPIHDSVLCSFLNTPLMPQTLNIIQDHRLFSVALYGFQLVRGAHHNLAPYSVATRCYPTYEIQNRIPVLLTKSYCFGCKQGCNKKKRLWVLSYWSARLQQGRQTKSTPLRFLTSVH